MKKKPPILVAVWAVAHLVLVVRGAVRLSIGKGAVQDVLAGYDAFSGSGNSYGFFAPGVASMPRSKLKTKWRGQIICQEVDLPGNREVALRAQTGVGMFFFGNDSLKRALAASWAATGFSMHPQASEVEVEVELQNLPTMAGWRTGERSSWHIIYRASFIKNKNSDRQK